MPNIQSAKKKVRKDKKRTKQNAFHERAVRAVVKSFASALKGADLKKAFSIIDKAAKRKVIHKNKAARLKSRISKLSSRKK